ncbi:MAG: type II toxin-antitoxin system HicB family antitoxin [Phormidesmis sp.]
MTMTSQASLSRKVLLYQDEDGFFIVEVPSLPGCFSQGETRDEAIENVKEAISLHIEVLIERGQPIPSDNVEIVSV